MKKIQIMPLEGIFQTLNEKKINSYVVSIRDPNFPFKSEQPSTYVALDILGKNCPGMIYEYFFDASPRNLPKEFHPYLPTETQIRRILEWAKDKDDIIVHCSAGVSRSAAIAFLIACTDRTTKEALEILEYRLHCPNKYILGLGMDILKNSKIIETIDEWERQHASIFLDEKELNKLIACQS